MVLLATSFFPVTLPSPYSGAKATKFGGGPMNLGGPNICLQVKAKAQEPSENNGTRVITYIQEAGLVYRQNFSIRSYEICVDRTLSLETMMNYLQETAVNHFKKARLHRDGFCCTSEMCKKNLIWVFTQMQVVAYRYPTWGDDVQVETWLSASGKNAVRLNWLLSDNKTGEIMTSASGVCVMMNKLTRRLSKIPEEVRREIGAYFVNSTLSLDHEDNKELPKLLDDNIADYICTGLSTRWSDLDVNQHVNHVKYVGFILESVPQSIMESHELSVITLAYRRECDKDTKLESLTSISVAADVGNLGHCGHVECNHLLRLEDGAEIVRGRTEWRRKLENKFGNTNHVPEESTEEF